MQRSKMIYAVADAALVLTSDFEKGGTWAGAIEQLAKLHLVPVFVREEANAGKGNTALLQHGAVRWPNPQNGDELSQALSKAAEAAAAQPQQETLSLALREQSASYQSVPQQPFPGLALTADNDPPKSDPRPSQALFNPVREILRRELAEPKSDIEVAELLNVAKPQAKIWLTRLVKDGGLERLTKPVRYRAARRLL